MEKIDYKQLACKIFCFVAFGLIAYALVKYALGYILPFLIAWGIAYLIYPIANELALKSKMSRKLASVVLLALFFIIIGSLLFLIGDRLLFEVQNLLGSLDSKSDEIASFIERLFERLGAWGENVPILNKLQNSELAASIKENINSLVTNVWKSFLSSLGSAVPNLAAGIVTILPNALFVSLITVIASFYFAADIDVLHKKLKAMLSPKLVERLRKIKWRMESGFKKYIKAYLIIFVITFAELFIGFLVLGIDYSFALALIIGLVDFLPVFGTGAILVPWGIILLLMKDYFVGVGILVLFAVITVVRQIIEPKIVGKSLGVHPLLTLVTVYLGFRFFGFFGMVFLPIATVIFFSREDDDKKKSDAPLQT